MPKRVKKKSKTRIRFKVYVSELEKEGIRYSAVYMKTGNHSIEQIVSIEPEEVRIGMVRKGWKIIQGLAESYPDDNIAIVSDVEGFDNCTDFYMLYSRYEDQLMDCDINWNMNIRVIREEYNPAKELILNKAKGFMDYSLKLQ